MTKHYFLLLILLLSFWGLGQDPLPRLTQELAKMKTDDSGKAVHFILNKQLKKQPQQKTAIQFWGFYVFDSLKLEQETDSMYRLVIQAPKHQQLKSAYRLYQYKGNQELDSSDFDHAVKDFYTALKLAQAEKNRKAEGQVERSIGMAYLKLDQNIKAENHLRTSLYIHQSLNDELGIANAAISLGNALKDQGKTKEAIPFYEMSLKLAQKLKNKRLIAGNYNNLGNAMRRLNRKQEAIQYFNKALEMNKQAKNDLWISFNYHNLGMTYQDLKQYDRAISYFKLSNDIKVKLEDSLSLISGYLSISESYAGLNDFQNAYRYLKEHIRLKDTLNLIEQANELSDLETKYQTEKKEAEIKFFKTQSELRKVKNEHLEDAAAKTRNYFLLAGLALVFLGIGFVFVLRSNNLKKRTNILLKEKNKQVEASHDALQQALNQLSVKNKEIIDSINYATYIQEASLPKMSYKINDALHFELFFAPKDIVSGDFYFSYQQYNRSVFGVGDCTGHGVPGAMVSLIGMNSMDKVVREERHNDSASMVDAFNEHVLLSLHRGGNMINDGMDLSLCLFDHSTNELQFTGANHNALLIRKRDQLTALTSPIKVEDDHFAIAVLNGARRPIGKTLSKEAFFTSSEKVIPGDRLVLFSDGYADQTGGQLKKKLKRATMLHFLLESSSLPVEEQIEFMKNAFQDWKSDSEQVDDVCLLIVEVC